MNKKNNRNVIEQKSYEFISLEERQGDPKQLFFTWFGANTHALPIVTGALAITIGLDFWWASLAILLGHGIGAVVMALHSAQGPRLGIPQVIQSRAQFGYYGVILPLLIVFTMYIGYGASSTIITGQGIHESLGINLNLSITLSLLPMVLFAIYGQKLIQNAMKYYTMIYIVIFIVLSLLVIKNVSLEMLNHGRFSFNQFFLVLSISVTWQITYGPYVSDYSRYFHPVQAKKTFVNTYIGSFISSAWLMILGAAIGCMAVNGSVMSQIKDLGGNLGLVLSFLIAIGLMLVNSLNIYGACIVALSIASNFIKFKTTITLRIFTTIVIGVILAVSATIGAGNFMVNIQNYLSFVLFFIVPWSVINLTDFYLLRRNTYDPESFMSKNGSFGKLRISSLAIYLLSVASQVPFVNNDVYQGAISKHLGGLDVAWVIGIFISFSLYYCFEKIKKESNVELTNDM
jgi:nucleobase:cation symporter-1, NCS1 family